MFEELLARFNLDRNHLTPDEAHTLNEWAKALSVQKITVTDIAEYVNQMITTLEKELHGYDIPKSFVEFLFRRSRRRHLEARLQNLLLLRDVLEAPARAMKFVEKRMQSLRDDIPHV